MNVHAQGITETRVARQRDVLCKNLLAAERTSFVSCFRCLTFGMGWAQRSPNPVTQRSFGELALPAPKRTDASDWISCALSQISLTLARSLPKLCPRFQAARLFEANSARVSR